MESELVICLESDVDIFQQGVIANNVIPGLLPVVYEEDRIVVQTSGLISLEAYLQSHTLTVNFFKELMDSYLGIMEDSLLYYLDWNNYCIEADKMFIYPDGSGLQLIYKAIKSEHNDGCPIKKLLYDEIIPFVKFNREEDWTFLIDGITTLNSISYTLGRLDVLYDAFLLRECEHLPELMKVEEEQIEYKKKKDSFLTLFKNFGVGKKQKVVLKGYADSSNGTVILKTQMSSMELIPCDNRYLSIKAEGRSLIIGRNKKTADIILNGKDIGKLHAEFISEKDNYYVRDLNSLNGTFVNNVKLLPYEMKEICEGDEVAFSSIQYKACLC